MNAFLGTCVSLLLTISAVRVATSCSYVGARNRAESLGCRIDVWHS